MIKRNILFPLVFFMVTIVWQWFFLDAVRWGEAAAISILTFLFAMFYDWAKVPYKWKK
ncbi:hypothetical protein [Lysinibacillus sp. FJAT-14222]|uniref:hypothetical protein n=1 Tax=Lysinibacillus sp. FJAT-14222 TaxID=1932366 RepID=UPI000AAEC5BD|nr:hypothetical protein [Lysinibacillus sp. FJAT-14222]